MNSSNWEKRFDVIADEKLRESVKKLYSFYNPEGVVRWWAGLFDPESGGFYYANSSRDYEGFLPDMESGHQISNKVISMFKMDLPTFYGPEITKKIISFYQSKQDPETGYFFHPQFPKDIRKLNVMRYSRDQDWSINELHNLGSAPLYPTALDRAKAGTVSTKEKEIAPCPFGSTPESAREYVKTKLRSMNIEGWSNNFQTQCTAFRAAGALDAVLETLDETQNPKYGLWTRGINPETGNYINLMDEPTEECPYGIFTSTYKILIMYNTAVRPYPHPIEMTKYAIDAILSRDPGIRVTYIFNPWATLANLRLNLVKTNQTDSLAQFDEIIKERIVDMVDALNASLGYYSYPDGSFSFLPGRSSPSIYGTPVSLGLPEGDVNAANLVLGLGTHVSNILGLDSPIPVFSKEHCELMMKLLREAKPIVKRPRPN